MIVRIRNTDTFYERMYLVRHSGWYAPGEKMASLFTALHSHILVCQQQERYGYKGHLLVASYNETNNLYIMLALLYLHFTW